LTRTGRVPVEPRRVSGVCDGEAMGRPLADVASSSARARIAQDPRALIFIVLGAAAIGILAASGTPPRRTWSRMATGTSRWTMCSTARSAPLQDLAWVKEAADGTVL
jgi:hypothetical protein